MNSALTAKTSAFAIALSLSALIIELDWNNDIPNKSEHVKALQGIVKEIAGDRASEIYPEGDMDADVDVV